MVSPRRQCSRSRSRDCDRRDEMDGGRESTAALLIISTKIATADDRSRASDEQLPKNADGYSGHFTPLENLPSFLCGTARCRRTALHLSSMSWTSSASSARGSRCWPA